MVADLGEAGGVVTAPVKVIYLAGSGRSGSTILGSVLGEIPGHFSVGELRFVWDRNVQNDRVCGCGAPFSQCPVWRSVMNKAFGDRPPDTRGVIALREAAMPLRLAPVVHLDQTRRWATVKYAAYLDILERLYSAVAEVTGARVIIDSSKYSSYGYLLSLIDSLDTRIVHLVRDPRAVAYSWTRKKMETTTSGVTAPMGRVNPARTAVDWALWSALAEQYSRADAHPPLRVRYEDFVRQPRDAVASVLRHAGENRAPLDFMDGSQAQLSKNHTVGGNPNRMCSGVVALSADTEWRTALSRSDQWMVAGLTFPAMVAYGYLRKVS